MFAVADTGPVHYLVLIGQASWVGALFETVFVPREVHDELTHPAAPDIVRSWTNDPPAWLAATDVPSTVLAQVDPALDAGERAAIALASMNRPDWVLMDDRAGVAAARNAGLRVIGTLGLLARAARLRLLDVHEAAAALERTNFRWTPELRARLLAQSVMGGAQ